MKSYVTKSFLVKKSNKELYKYCFNLAINYKALYNHTLFFIRNLFTALKKPNEERFHNEVFVCHHIFNSIGHINTNKKKNIKYPNFHSPFISYNSLDNIFKDMKDEFYYSLPSQCNQQAMKAVYTNMDSYFKALKEYKKNPSKFLGKPKFPKYLKILLL